MTIEYLVEIEAYNLNTTLIETLYYGTGDFTTLPTDSPANQFYSGVVSGDITFQSELFGDARLIGQPTIGIGSIELMNKDGSLDSLDDYAFGGRSLTIYRVEDDDFSSKTTWLDGRIETATISYDNVTLTIKDKSFSLSQPIQSNLYLGSNSGGNGIEGDPDNIKDTPKPLAYGRLQNVTPILVNTGRRIYQVHDGSIQSVDNVYDGRTTLSFQADVADNATLQALAVAGGNYATCLNEGLIKIGTSPQRGFTVDVHGDNSGGYIDRAGAISRRIIENQTELTVSDLNTASFTQFDVDFNYETGIYIDTQTDVSVVISEVLGPLNYWAFSRSGLLSVGVFTLPSGSAVENYTDDEIIDSQSPIDRLINNDPTNGVPVYRVNYEWGRNYTIQTRDNVYTSVTDQDVAFTSLEYRTSSDEDLTVQTKYPLSPELTVTSQLFLQANADTDRTRILDLYKDKRFFYRFLVHDRYADGLSLSDVINVTFPRFGLDSGVLLRVVGISEDASDKQVEITAFG